MKSHAEHFFAAKLQIEDTGEDTFMRYKLRTASLAFLALLIISGSTWAKQASSRLRH